MSFYNYSPLTLFDTSSNIQHEYTYTGQDVTFFDTYSVIASKFIAAFTDETGMNQDLRLAASSNIQVEGVSGVNIYVSDNDAKVKYYTSSNDENSVRNDYLNMQAYSSNIIINGVTSNVYVMESGDPSLSETASILVRGTDPFQSVYLNDMRVMSGFNGDDQQHVDTTHSNFRFEKPIVANNMYVTDEFKATRGVFDNDVIVGNSFYSCNLNVWRDIESTLDQDIVKIGYGFKINEKNQLELIKYSKFNDGDASKSISKKIATFGNNDIKFSDNDDSNYLVFDSMGVTQYTSSNGLSSIGSPVWQVNTDKKIYYMDNFVGINKINPEFELDVVGTINTEKIIVFEQQIVSDKRVKENITDTPLDVCLSNIMNLNVYNFNYVKDEGSNMKTGFIAQQVYEAIPHAVKQIEFEGYDDFNIIETNTILANLVGAVKKLAEKINL